MSSNPVTGVPLPPRPGAEMVRLALFHRDVHWTGTIQAGGMGPGSPAMTATGEGRHHTIQNGLWIDGDLLSFESIGHPPVRLRLTYHHTMTWRNDVSVQDGAFTLVEQYVCSMLS